MNTNALEFQMGCASDWPHLIGERKPCYKLLVSSFLFVFLRGVR